MGVELRGHPGDALWTLYMRAVEAGRPDAVRRPKAVELLERIDSLRDARRAAHGQWQALRAFDERCAASSAHPTGRWSRWGRGRRRSSGAWTTAARWLTVELPETLALRAELSAGRPRALACSALDDAWMDEVDARAAS